MVREERLAWSIDAVKSDSGDENERVVEYSSDETLAWSMENAVKSDSGDEKERVVEYTSDET